MVSLLRRLDYRRAVLHSDGEPSIAARTTANLLAAPFAEMVLHESPVCERATNGVAEPASRELKGQTRTILSWMPTMATDAISFVRMGKDRSALKCDVLDVLGRNSLRSLEKLSTTAQR